MPKPKSDVLKSPEDMAAHAAEVAEATRKIARAMKGFMGAGLKRRAIILLIQDLIPGKTVSIATIDQVLDAASRIDSHLSDK